MAVDALKFGRGSNDFLASAPGDNFVTDLGKDASPRQLASIGVFGEKRHYAIQFLDEDAFNSGVRAKQVKANIFGIPDGSTISGSHTVTRLH